MSQSDLFGLPAASAVFSPCERYRYALSRSWSQGDCIAWIMLNPSTATADEDDPTIRRCIAFSRAWHFGRLLIVNIYALRSTDPAGLWTVDDPVGPDNDEHIRAAIRQATRVVCAWGANAEPDRSAHVLELVRSLERVPHCLGTTKAGEPRHPLYIRSDTPLEVLTAPETT